MAKKPHNVRLLQYFFTETNVSALNNHDPDGERNGTIQRVSHEFVTLSEEPLQHGVAVTLESDDENGGNAPYSFKISAYGVFEPISSETEEKTKDYIINAQPVGIQILFGAIREHLAAITARHPWGTYISSMATITDKATGNEEPVDEEVK